VGSISRFLYKLSETIYRSDGVIKGLETALEACSINSKNLRQLSLDLSTFIFFQYLCRANFEGVVRGGVKRSFHQKMKMKLFARTKYNIGIREQGKWPNHAISTFQSK